jgi:hypothetical protein
MLLKGAQPPQEDLKVARSLEVEMTDRSILQLWSLRRKTE